MATKESDVDEFIKNLTEARFEKIFDNKKEELDQFYTFLRNRAVPAGGYVISVPLEEGGLFWLFFKIKSVKEIRTKLNLELEGPEVFIPNDSSDRSIPEDCRDYPVWWFEEGQK